MTRLGLFFVAVALAVVLAGCGKSHGFGDAPVNQGKIDSTPAEIIEMPDQFGNVATKCDGHGHRVYSTTEHAVGAIDDPGCAK